MKGVAQARPVTLPRTLRQRRREWKRVVDSLLRQGYTLRLAPSVESGRFDRR